MSNGMAPEMGGAPKSVLNPVDMAGMKQSGQLGQNTTIGQYLETMGIKWDDTIQVARQKMAQQVQGATSLGKAQMSAQAGGPKPMGPPSQGMAPPPSGSVGPSGMEGLMRG